MYLKNEEYMCVITNVAEAGFVCKPDTKVKKSSEGKRFAIYRITDVKFYPMTPPQGVN